MDAHTSVFDLNHVLISKTTSFWFMNLNAVLCPICLDILGTILLQQRQVTMIALPPDNVPCSIMFGARIMFGANKNIQTETIAYITWPQ